MMVFLLNSTLISFPLCTLMIRVPGEFFPLGLNVFGKDKEPCMKCRNQIEKFKIAGRGTYICNHCQKIFR